MLTFNPFPKLKTATLANVRIAIAMYKHICGCQPEGIFVIFNTKYMRSFYLVLLSFGSAIIHRLCHSSN